MQTREFVTLTKETVSTHVTFAKSCYLLNTHYLYKDKQYNKKNMEGGQGYVIPLYNAHHKPLYGMKTFTSSSQEINLQPYHLLDREAYLVKSNNDKIKLIYTWQLGVSLDQLTEAELIQMPFINRLNALRHLSLEIKRLHDAHFIHADIKTSNAIFNTITDQLSLIDLDSSRLIYSTNQYKTTLEYDFEYAQQVHQYAQSDYQPLNYPVRILSKVNTTYKQDLYALGILISHLFPECRAHFYFVNATDDQQIIFERSISYLLKILLHPDLLTTYFTVHHQSSFMAAMLEYLDAVINLTRHNATNLHEEKINNIFKETICKNKQYLYDSFIENSQKNKNKKIRLTFSDYEEQPEDSKKTLIHNRKKILINKTIFYVDDKNRAYLDAHNTQPEFIIKASNLRNAVKEIKYNHLLGRKTSVFTHPDNTINVITPYLGKSISALTQQEIIAIPLKKRFDAFINLLSELSTIHQAKKLYANNNLDCILVNPTTMQLHLTHFQFARSIHSKNLYDIHNGKLDYIPHRLQLSNITKYVQDLQWIAMILILVFPEINDTEKENAFTLRKALSYVCDTLTEKRADYRYITAERLILYFKELSIDYSTLTLKRLEEIKNNTLMGLVDIPSDQIVERPRPKENAQILQIRLLEQIANLPITHEQKNRICSLSATNCRRLQFIILKLQNNALLTNASLNHAVDRITCTLPKTLTTDANITSIINSDLKKISIANNTMTFYYPRQALCEKMRAQLYNGYINHDLSTAPDVVIKYITDETISDKRIRRDIAFHSLFSPKYNFFVKTEDNTNYHHRGIIMTRYEGTTFNEKKHTLTTDIERLTVFISFLEQLAIIHHHYRIHRDLSETNIIISSDNKVNLIDFEFSHKAFSTRCRGATPGFELEGNNSFQHDMFGACVLLKALFSFIIIENGRVDYVKSLEKKTNPLRQDGKKSVLDFNEESELELEFTYPQNNDVRKLAIVTLAQAMTDYTRSPPCTVDRALSFCRKICENDTLLSTDSLQTIINETLNAPIQVEDILQQGAFQIDVEALGQNDITATL